MIDVWFSGEIKEQIHRYCNFLNNISNEYDALVFMARKAICFYNALVESGELSLPETTIITSSRVLQYNCDILKDKKVALIDDIIVKGKTIAEAEKQIKKVGVTEYDVFCIASPETFYNKKIKNCNGYQWELSNDEVLVLGNAITNYIASNSCTYNIDYPVYSLKPELFETFIGNYISDESCNMIPSETSNNDNELYAQILYSNELINYIESNLKFKLDEESFVTKVRFYVNKRTKRIFAIPIVILPEISKANLSLLYDFLTNGKLNEMIGISDDQKCDYGMVLDTVQYLLSCICFESIMDKEYADSFSLDVEKIKYAFPPSYINDILQCTLEIGKHFRLQKKIVKSNPLLFSEVFGYFFEYICHKHQSDTEHKDKYLFSEILDYCKSQNNISNISSILSIVFDYAIDTGLVVPINKLYSLKTVRAYKLSEQYELKEKEFDLFIYMYNYYLSQLKTDNMSAIEAEKLLVLFFREVIPDILSERIQKNDNNVKNSYGIMYAMYGPVVSDDCEKLNVRQSSFLTKRLMNPDRDQYRRLYTKRKKNDSLNVDHELKDKYFVKESENLLENEFDLKWIADTKLFANRYVTLHRLFDYHRISEKIDLVKTYDKLLVLLAIGFGQTNQLLALGSEVKMYFDTAKYDDINTFCKSYDSIETGIVSGMWKYICFKKEILQKIVNAMVALNESEQEKYNDYTNTIDNYKSLLNRADEQKKHISENLDESINKFMKLGGEALKERDEFKPSVVKETLNKNKTVDDKMKCLDQYYDQLINRIKEKIYAQYELRDRVDIALIQYNPTYDLNRTKFCINKNKNIEDKFDSIMDDIGLFFYEIAICWRIIIEKKYYKGKLKNPDTNSNYINQIKELLRLHPRMKAINERYRVYNEHLILRRLNELKYEADLLLNKINEFIKDENVSFNECNRFFVIKRDDGNTIEDDEILHIKQYEAKFNSFFGILEDSSVAAFKNTPQNYKQWNAFLKKNYFGYTLIKYECNNAWDSILETKANCFACGIKTLVHDILNNHENCMITITDED